MTSTPLLQRCPRLVRLQGQPVYVAPEYDGNCFFYQGRYWVLTQDSTWHACPDFDGLWQLIEACDVPPALLRLPASAFHALPPMLGDGAPYLPPAWENIWGDDWRERHAGWTARESLPHEAAVPRSPQQQAQELLRGSGRSKQRRPAVQGRTREHA